MFHCPMAPQQLLLLLVGLPPTPSSLRVRVWRRLRSLGAVPLKRSAYLLPDTADRYEDFQWLAQEIQRDGGDATLIRVQQIENVAPAEVLRLFHEPRDQDYKLLAARYRKPAPNQARTPTTAIAAMTPRTSNIALFQFRRSSSAATRMATTAAGKTFAAIPAPSAAPLDRLRPAAKATRPSIISRVGKASKRQNRTGVASTSSP